MWGSDDPHDEGTYVGTRAQLRQLFHDAPLGDRQAACAGALPQRSTCSIATALAPFATGIGPTVREIAQSLEKLRDRPSEAMLKTFSAIR